MAIGVEAFFGLASAGFEQNMLVGGTGAEILSTRPMIWWD